MNKSKRIFIKGNIDDVVSELLKLAFELGEKATALEMILWKKL